MKGNFVYSKDLIPVYGEKLPLFADGQLTPVNYVNLQTTQKQRVTIVTKQGPYSVVKTLHRNGSYTKFIIENSLIKEEEIVPFYEEIVPILDKMFPNRYHIDRSNGYLYLHYPELTLTNNTNNKHTIYDMIVLLCFGDYNNGYLSSIHGTRVSFSPAELSCGYVHSHLPKHPGTFQSFCQGSSSSFAKFVSDLNKLISPDEFEVFLLQLKEYLQWESLEGGPHIGMHTVLSNSGSANAHLTNSTIPRTLNDLTHKRYIYESLEALVNNQEYHCLLVQNGNSTIFDITRNAQVGYKFEVEVLAPKIASSYLVKYNEKTQEYVGQSRNNGIDRLPSYSSNVIAAMRNLKITPRLIEPTKSTTDDKIVTRVGINNLQEISFQINALLAFGYTI